MILYSILFLFLTPLAFINDYQFKKYKFLYFLILVLISSIRFETGTDWESYHYYYQNILSDEYYLKLDYAYYLLNYFSKLVFNSYIFVQFFLVFVSLYLIDNAIKKISISYRTSLIYFLSFSIFALFPTRQFIAIAFLLHSFYFFKVRSNFVYFLLNIFLALLFHWSSIVPSLLMLFFYFKNYYFQFALIFFVLIYLYFFGGDFNYFYLTEYKDFEDIRYIEFSFGLIFRLAVCIFIIFNWWFFSKECLYESLILITVTILNCLLIGQVDVFGRILYYGYFFEIFCLSAIFKFFHYRFYNFRLMFAFLFFVICYTRLVASIYNYYDAFVPYKSYVFEN